MKMLPDSPFESTVWVSAQYPRSDFLEALRNHIDIGNRRSSSKAQDKGHSRKHVKILVLVYVVFWAGIKKTRL